MDSDNVNLQNEYLAKRLDKNVQIVQELPQELVGNKQAYFVSSNNSLVTLDSSGLKTGKGVTINKRVLPTSRDGNMGRLLADVENDQNMEFSRDNAVRVINRMMTNIPKFDGLVDQVNRFDNTKDGQDELLNIYMDNEAGHIVEDEATVNRVKDVVELLESGIAKNDPSVLYKPYKYYVHDDDEFNASCAMGRIIRVNQGLLDTVKDSDELLAATIAHEMGHGESLHHAHSTFDLNNIQLGAALLTAATNDKALGVDAMRVVLTQMEKVTSVRVSEREADYLAFGYLLDAGINPGSTAALFQRMSEINDNHSDAMAKLNDKVEKIKNDRLYDEIINPHDHPRDLERRNNAAKLLTDYSNGHITVDKDTVCIDGKPLVSPAYEAIDENRFKSSEERAYMVMGNLAVAFHNGLHHEQAYANGNTVMLGDKVIMDCNEMDKPASEIVKTLNELNSKVQDRPYTSDFDKVQNPSLLQYDSKGNSKNLPYIESENVIKVVQGFSDKVSESMSAVSQISDNLSEKEYGEQLGNAFADLLGSKEAMDFVRVIRNQVKQNAENLENVYHGYSNEEARLIKKANSLEGNEKVKADYNSMAAGYGRMKVLNQFHLSPDYLKVRNSNLNSDNEIFADLVNYRSYPEVVEGLQKVVADNPKAMANLKEMNVLGDRIANDIEVAQYNILGNKKTGYAKSVENSMKSLQNSIKQFDADCKKAGVSRKTNSMYMNATPELNESYKKLCQQISIIAPKVNALRTVMSDGQNRYALALNESTVLQYDELGKRLAKMQEIEKSYKKSNMSDVLEYNFQTIRKPAPFKDLTEEQQKIVLKGFQYARDHEDIFADGQMPADLNYNSPTGESGKAYFARFTNFMNSKGFSQYLNEEVNKKASELMCNLDVEYDNKGKAEYVSRTKLDTLDNTILTHSLGNNQKDVYSNLIVKAKELVLNDSVTTLRTSKKDTFGDLESRNAFFTEMQKVQNRNKNVIYKVSRENSMSNVDISPQFLEQMAKQIDREKRQELGLVTVAEKTGKLVKHIQNNKHKVAFER